MDNPNGTAAGLVGICKWTEYVDAMRHAPPASPLAPDVRLFALQEQIAKALERIADALEGLKPPTSQKPPLNMGY